MSKRVRVTRLREICSTRTDETEVNMLQLFVFDEVLTNYTDGIIVMVAESREEAISLYIEKMDLDSTDRWDAGRIAELVNSNWYALPLEKGSMVYCYGGG